MLYLNSYPVAPTRFPDKTTQVWQLPDEASDPLGRHVIDWRYESDEEIFHLMQLVDLVRAENRTYNGIDLVVDYLPYARQDKHCSNTTTFALQTLAKVLNALDFRTVYVLDVHSSRAAELIDRLVNTTGVERIRHVANNVLKARTIVYPDAGAYTRYAETYHTFASGENHTAIGHKLRDELTGELFRYKLETPLETIPEPVLVIDDICDGGATFIALAEELKQRGVKDFNLYVTHGIFSKGTGRLYEAGYKKIFTYKGNQP